jgi:hypothetical protein
VRRWISMATACAAVFVAACGRPPLSVLQKGQTVVIDVQSLGEYPSDMERLRLTDADHRVVWEIKGRDGPQINSVTLKIGENPAQLDDVSHGVYDVIVPRGQSTFTIEPGARYVVEVWGKDARQWTRRKEEFTAPGR